MPPQTTVPPFRVAASAAGTSGPIGAKTASRRGLGRRHRRIAGPFGAERAGEILRLLVARPGESEQAAALVARYLRHDMGGGAKAVDAHALRLAGHPQGAESNQPGAHQRRRLDIAVLLIDGKQ